MITPRFEDDSIYTTSGRVSHSLEVASLDTAPSPNTTSRSLIDLPTFLATALRPSTTACVRLRHQGMDRSHRALISSMLVEDHVVEAALSCKSKQL